MKSEFSAETAKFGGWGCAHADIKILKNKHWLQIGQSVTLLIDFKLVKA